MTTVAGLAQKYSHVTPLWKYLIFSVCELPWHSCTTCCWESRRDNEGMKNACAATRFPLLWFQGPAYSQPPGQGTFIKTHDATGCNQSTLQLISCSSLAFHHLSTESQWNFPLREPWVSKTLTCPARKEKCCSDADVLCVPKACLLSRLIHCDVVMITYTARVLQSANGSAVFVAATHTHLCRGGKVLYHQGFICMSFVSFPKEQLNILK